MKNTSVIFFYIVLIAVSTAFIYLISPFFIAIFLAIITSHLFRVPNQIFLDKFSSKRLAALATLGLITLSVVGPIISVFYLVSIEAQKSFSTIQTMMINSLEQLELLVEKNVVINLLNSNPITKGMFDPDNLVGINETILGYFKEYTSMAFKFLQGVFLDFTSLGINFLIMLYLLYFLLQDADVFSKTIKSFIPLKEEEKDHFIEESVRVIDATIVGTILIGVFEGIWGSVIFVLLDIPSPVTWGLLMTVLSMLPVLGTNSILLPVAIYKLATGNFLSGMLVLIIGCGGILINQNIIKPKLVGDRSGVHPAILILTSLGGISLLGVIGFIVGPSISAIFIVLWKQFRDRIPSLKSFN